MPKVTLLEEPIDFDNICPIVYALSIIGQKWKIPILWHLADEGTLRYNELKRVAYFIYKQEKSHEAKPSEPLSN